MRVVIGHCSGLIEITGSDHLVVYHDSETSKDTDSLSEIVYKKALFSISPLTSIPYPRRPLDFADNSSRPESPTRRSSPLLSSHLWLGPVENLQELCHSVSHPRVHVRLGALDVVV